MFRNTFYLFFFTRPNERKQKGVENSLWNQNIVLHTQKHLVFKYLEEKVDHDFCSFFSFSLIVVQLKKEFPFLPKIYLYLIKEIQTRHSHMKMLQE